MRMFLWLDGASVIIVWLDGSSVIIVVKSDNAIATLFNMFCNYRIKMSFKSR